LNEKLYQMDDVKKHVF